MSIDKSVVRTSLIPSLLNIYDYNKARKQDNICIYEISKVYDENYNEDTLLTILMKGNLVTTSWNSNSLKVDFYLIKGIIENILDYVGLKNRYSFEKDSINDIHPKIGARIFVDKKEVGIIHCTIGMLIGNPLYPFLAKAQQILRKHTNRYQKMHYIG